jgi:hypothetical protein
MAQGKLQETLEAYRQYLAIIKRLAEQDKTNAGWQQDLSLSYEKVGNVLVAMSRSRSIRRVRKHQEAVPEIGSIQRIAFDAVTDGPIH